MYKTIVKDTANESFGILILLVGRGQSAEDIAYRYSNYTDLNAMRIIAIEPQEEWYPIPNGINDQERAITGIKESAPTLKYFIDDIKEKYNVNRKDIVLVGFSAGAVMAIQIVSNSDEAYGGLVCHNGAILDTENLHKSKNNTPFLLIHSQDDDCFSWEERYIPMKNSLIEKEYNINFFEEEYGGHYMSYSDVSKAGDWIKAMIGYPTF